MKAADVMTRNVIVTTPDASIVDVARLMLQNGISGLPVVSDGRLVGIVTEGDFLRRAETGTERHRPGWLEFLLGPGRLAEDYAHSHGRKVEEVMTSEPSSVSEDTPVEEIVALMERKHIKRVPIVAEGRVVGIVSRSNLLNALASLSRVAAPVTTSDAALRDRILKELGSKPWAPMGLNVVVRDGEADLSGVIVDERERQAIKVAVENIPGVKAVHDHITWIEPVTGMFLFSPEDEAARTKTAEAKAAERPH